MDAYLLIKTLHIVSSTVLFGTGIGIAFFMLIAQRQPDLAVRYFAARFTVIADLVFTTPAVIIQPLSGWWLVISAGFDPFATWLVLSYALYAVAGACWLPVVWLQLRMRQMCQHSLQNNKPLPVLYHRYFRIWFALGWPAFVSLLTIFYLMIAKPVLS